MALEAQSSGAPEEVFWLVALVCIDGVERRASAKASVEVCRARGVKIGGATMAIVAGAKVVVVESLTTGTADNLCALGTLWKVSVVSLPSLSSASSWSFSTVVCISVTFTCRS